MFQIIVSLIIGVIIGWNFHLFYMALEPKETTFKRNDIIFEENTTTQEDNKTVISRIEENNISIKEINGSISPFQTLLNEDKFTYAMEIYAEANETKRIKYGALLKDYFYKKLDKFPKKTIEQMLLYIEIEPEAKDIYPYLIQYYNGNGNFEKAIKLLFELQENYTEEDNSTINNDLNKSIENYIEYLTETKELKKLVTFLEDLISRNLTSEKYIIRLAEAYYELDNYERSYELLEEIDIDSPYASKVQLILKNIEEKEKELSQYTYKIPITPTGSHYSVNVTINDTPLTLLIDTGATYTFIDSQKIIPSLIVKKEILLNTAGGEIVANLCQAETLVIGNIVLKDFEITIAPFQSKDSDGLLGMNFFQQFNFKIDQNRGFLYLMEK